MALLNIRTDSDPLLRKISKEVKEIDDKILRLIGDMKETMDDAQGIGIAAPQVGKLKRIIIVKFIEENAQALAMINPEITEKEGTEIDIEGCLSVPGFRGSVERPHRVKVEYQDKDGITQSIEKEGYNARILCHEIDHLNGILFTDKYIDEYVLNEDGDYVIND